MKPWLAISVASFPLCIANSYVSFAQEPYFCRAHLLVKTCAWNLVKSRLLPTPRCAVRSRHLSTLHCQSTLVCMYVTEVVTYDSCIVTWRSCYASHDSFTTYSGGTIRARTQNLQKAATWLGCARRLQTKTLTMSSWDEFEHELETWFRELMLHAATKQWPYDSDVHGDAKRKHSDSCSTLQDPATHIKTLQHTSRPCNTHQHPATHINTLQHTSRPCNTHQHPAT